MTTTDEGDEHNDDPPRVSVQPGHEARWDPDILEWLDRAVANGRVTKEEVESFTSGQIKVLPPIFIPGGEPLVVPIEAERHPEQVPAYQEGDEADLTEEEFIGFGVGDAGRRVPIPPEEQTRRTLLIVLGIAYVLMFFLNIGFALALSAAHYQLVGAAIGSFTSLVAAGLGGAFTYYFTQKGK